MTATRFHLADLVVVLCAMLAAACAAPLATTEQKLQGERRLLAPYLEQRVVACSELTVDISANFNVNVSNPGVDGQRQRFERIAEDGLVEKVWTNITGDRAGWFNVTIGAVRDATEVDDKPLPSTTFKVFNEFRLRIHERGAMTLDAVAAGPVVVVEAAGSPARSVADFRISDGALRSR